MDRVNQLRGQGDDTADSSLDSSSQAYLTAEDDSTFFSLSEAESSKQNVSSISVADTSNPVSDEFQLGKPIEASNILSGNVNIFDDNSCDGNDLVIDDKEHEEVENSAECEKSIAERSQETLGNPVVFLSIDGVHINAMDTGNGFYLYRRIEAGLDELAAVQVIERDGAEPSFKFLNVRENEEGILELYENIVKVVDCPNKEKSNPEKSSHLPVPDLSKVLNENPSSSTSSKMEIGKTKEPISLLSKDAPLDPPPPESMGERIMKFGGEARQSSLIGSYTPMSFHSTPNKEGVPLTKTMVDLQLHPNKLPVTSTKTIELNTDKQKISKTGKREVSPICDTSTYKKNESEKDLNVMMNHVIKPDTILLPKKETSKNEFEEEVKEETVTTKDDKDNSNKDIGKLPKSEIIPEINKTLGKVPEKLKSTTTCPYEKGLANEVISLLPQKDFKNHLPTENIVNSLHKKCDTEQKNIEEIELKSNLELKSVNQVNDNNMDLKESINVKDVIEIPTKMAVNDLTIKESSKIMEFETLNKDVTIEKESGNNNLEQKSSEIKPKVNEIVDVASLSAENINEMNSKETKSVESIQQEEQNSNEIKREIPEINDAVELIQQGEQKSNEIKPEISEINDAASLTAENIKDMDLKQSVDPIEQATQKSSEIKPKITEIVDVASLTAENNKEIGLNETESVKRTEQGEPSEIKPLTTEIVDSKQAKSIQPNEQEQKASEIKSKITEIVDVVEYNKETDSKETKNVEQIEQGDKSESSCNNNVAVPFGKWTEANRQAFLIKIKETKVTHSSSTNQIKQTNDLNRRDVLKKIGSVRQVTKETFPKRDFKIDNNTNKTETVRLSNTTQQTSIKERNPAIDLQKEHNRTEMMNQDLIDKTIDGILKDKTLPAKHDIDIKVSTKAAPEKSREEIILKSCLIKEVKSSPVSILDDIQKKMNELHGPPHTERLPSTSRFNQNITTCPISDSVISVNTATGGTFNDKISDEDILERAPVTGDTVSNLKLKHQKTNSQIPQKRKETILNREKTPVITETEFEKFARGNSVTCSDKITVALDPKQPHKFRTVVETSVPKYFGNPTPNVHKSAFYPVYGRNSLFRHNYPNMSSVPPEEAVSKNYASKFQVTYQSPEKKHIETPILRLEEKPVKVVYLEGSNDFIPYNLNVQGQQLMSSSEKEPEKELMDKTVESVNNKQTCSQSDKPEKVESTVLNSACDSELKLNIDTNRLSEPRTNNSHKRKQILSAVKTPVLELIEPDDLESATVSKRKKKVEDINKARIDDDNIKHSKSHVPKKSYLLGRNETQTAPEQNTDTSSLSPDNKKSPIANEYLKHEKPVHTLDSLVKAAELLETQPDVVKSLVQPTVAANSESPTLKRGRGRPRKYPLSDGSPINKSTSPRKKPDKIKSIPVVTMGSEINKENGDENIAENWTMGKINEKIVCPICNKLFRSEEVVYKHVQHCCGFSPKKDESLAQDLKKGRLRSSRSDASNSENHDNVASTRAHREGMRLVKCTDDVVTTEKIMLVDNKKEILERHNVVNKPPSTRRKSSCLSVNLGCDVCGKEFRQMTYLTKHKLLHENDKPKKHVVDVQKSSTTCETCGKEFRKLHHLVQHRLIHTQDNTRSQRKVSTDHRKSSALNTKQIDTQDNTRSQRKVSTDHRKSSALNTKQIDTQDNTRSQRKVSTDHRKSSALNTKQTDTQDNTRSQRKVSTDHRKSSALNTKQIDKAKDSAGFRCEQCDKSFRKLHHLVEHRETHKSSFNSVSVTTNTDNKGSNGDNTEKDPPHCTICNKTFRKLHHLIEHKETHSDNDKIDPKKNSLVKDIIHECSLCYMVFPNEHSLNKHAIFCRRKKRSSGLKRVSKPGEGSSKPSASDENEEDIPVAQLKVNDTFEIINDTTTEFVQERVLPHSKEEQCDEVVKQASKRSSAEDSNSNITREESVTPSKLIKLQSPPKEYLVIKDSEKNEDLVNDNQMAKLGDVFNKKIDTKEDDAKTKLPINTSVPKENMHSITIDSADSSEDEDVRYMLNPDYKNEFMRVSANKRSSLQIDYPNKKDIKRRTSIQHPPRVHRLPRVPTLKVQPVIARPPRSPPPAASSSDESDNVTYSFPTKPAREEPKKKDTPKAAMISKLPKKLTSVDHRCDCGALFMSQALLTRHHTVAHTPPRIRRHRSPPKAPAVSVVRGNNKPVQSSFVAKSTRSKAK